MKEEVLELISQKYKDSKDTTLNNYIEKYKKGSKKNHLKGSSNYTEITNKHYDYSFCNSFCTVKHKHVVLHACY